MCDMEVLKSVDLLHLLHDSLQQAGSLADVPHNIACTEGVDALPNAGLLIALKKRLLGRYGTDMHGYQQNAGWILELLVLLT